MVERRASQVIAPELLALLVCPLTHQPLHPASAELLTRLSLEGALVREDGRVAFAIRDGIPVLLPDEAIPLDPPAT